MSSGFGIIRLGLGGRGCLNKRREKEKETEAGHHRIISKVVGKYRDGASIPSNLDFNRESSMLVE